MGEWWDGGRGRRFPKKEVWERMVEDGVREEEERRWKEGMQSKVTLQTYSRVQTQMGMADYLVGAQGYRPGEDET